MATNNLLATEMGQKTTALGWIDLNDETPPVTVPVMFWGSKLTKDDFPITGSICACHNWIILDKFWTGYDDEEVDEREHTKQHIGTPTHWLRWWPVPED